MYARAPEPSWLLGLAHVVFRMTRLMDFEPKRVGGRADWTRALRVMGICAFGTALLSSEVEAAQLGSEGSVASVEVHGFVSQGFIFTLRNDYLATDSTSGSFDFSEVGINFTKELTENLQLGLQLFAQNLGDSGNYTPEADWFYIAYRWQDWLGLRAGRLKIPYGLYNEIQDVDSARVPVMLPGSVYPVQSREILFAHTGAELYGFLRMPSLGALEYRVFGGSIFLDADSLTPPGAPLELDFHVPYVVGGRLLWETPLDGLRVGASVEAVRLETTVFVPTIPTFLITGQSWLWVASAEYLVSDLSLSAEYSRWTTKQRSDNPTLSPALDDVSERAYAMASYRVTPWIQPGAYYSLLFPNAETREGREDVQHDLAMTLRFDMNHHWLFKLEGHFMSGTAGLLNPLRVNPVDISTADRYWAAFFLKTTAHF